jgi:DNA-binding phage protein
MSEPTVTRHDGWTPERQILFLKAFARTRSVTAAAASAGMAREGAYRFRRRTRTACSP